MHSTYLMKCMKHLLSNNPFPSSFTKVCSTYSFQAETVAEMSARVKGYLSPGQGLRKGSGTFGIPKVNQRTEARISKPLSVRGLMDRDRPLRGKHAEFPSTCKSSHCERPLVLNRPRLVSGNVRGEGKLLVSPLASPHTIAALSVQPVPWVLVDSILGRMNIDVSTSPPDPLESCNTSTTS